MLVILVCNFLLIQTDLIIMDFAKAFDKVSHRRLLYKLEYYRIQTHTLNWIQAFLSDRTQTVVIDGVTSNTVPLTSAWYARDFTSGFDICKFLFKYPRDLFPFEVILSMWVFHLRLY
jgi:hypothetical protein